MKDKTVDTIIRQVAQKTGHPYAVVRLAYRSMWDFIKQHIEELPLHDPDIMSEEEFKKYRTSFNIPSIGKLYVDYPFYKSQKESYQKYLQEHDNNN